MLFLLAVLIPGIGCGAGADTLDRQIPAPVVDARASTAKSDVAVLAGGCFWGLQGMFEHVKGVNRVVAGYSGGDRSTAHYEMVGTETTGHAESVEITFDPHQISYGQLLRLYFSVAHDPTQLNRQGPDHGPQYRSTIFPADAKQREIATKYIAQLDAAHVFPAKIVTTLEDGKTFYPAEAYHQDFLVRNPDYPYIVINDIPKVRNLSLMFPDIYRTEPVLVTPRAATARRGG
jgi:peptide-methionine (S)-S-oxide reductase